jgi:hypothetical protein
MRRLHPAELMARQDYTGLMFDEISLNLSLRASKLLTRCIMTNQGCVNRWVLVGKTVGFYTISLYLPLPSDLKIKFRAGCPLNKSISLP